MTDHSRILQLLLFPEGNDLYPGAVAASHNYADSHNLPRYEYVLHPRTKAFTLAMENMRQGNRYL